jgi:hypothetical protein
MNSDFKELLRIFNAAKVRYLVIGGIVTMQRQSCHRKPMYAQPPR